MNAVERVDRVLEWLLSIVRGRWLPWLLNQKFGRFGDTTTQWIVLLFFTCFIRPSDLTGESDIRLPFKRFGFAYALAPATLYGSATIAFFKQFETAIRSAPPPDTPVTSLILLLVGNKIMMAVSVLMIIGVIYAYGTTRWACTLLICATLGPTRANKKRASLAYFLLKSCANATLFSLFACMIATAETVDEKTVFAINEISQRTDAFLASYRHSIILSIAVLAMAVVGFACTILCHRNGKAAMREIYLTDATSELATEIKVLVAVTIFAILSFSFRLVGVGH